MGLVAASVQSGLPLFLGAYPITPASGILEELSRYKHFGIRTFQAEDEIAAVGAALGASFGGSLGVSTSSGPGVVLKMETIGLAVALELPLLILDIQRAGPATGMPTKPEQADLMLVLYGRHAESPVPVVAASTPAVARRRARGVADRAQVPDAGLSPLGRVPGQRLGAVVDPRRVGASRHLDVVRGQAQPRRPVPPVPARRRDARPPVGDSGNAGPRAPDRRAREGRRQRQRLLRPRQPRPHGSDPRAQGRRHRRRHSELQVEGDEDADVLVAGWGGRTGRSRRPSGGSARTGRRSRTRTSRTSTRSRAIPKTCSAASTRCSSRR